MTKSGFDLRIFLAKHPDNSERNHLINNKFTPNQTLLEYPKR